VLLLQAAEMRHPIFTRLMLFITWLGDPLFLTGLLAVVGVWLLVRRWWSAVLYIVLAGGGVGVLNILIKQSYQRPRPNMVPMLLDPSGFSFPSGHTMGATGAYGALLVIGLYLLPRRRWQAALALLIGLLVLLIGSSRVYLGVHYPTDVLGGWLAGGAWLLLATHFTCLVVWIRLRYVIGMRFP
jgi:undecaprenyl-diphosphatase